MKKLVNTYIQYRPQISTPLPNLYDFNFLVNQEKYDILFLVNRLVGPESRVFA